METTTVQHFLLTHGDIDCNPVHQRPDREPKLVGTTAPSKAQEIMRCLISGQNIGVITIHRTPGKKFKFESIDGGHRKRYIIDFYNNRFPLFNTGKFYRDLDATDRATFLTKNMFFCVYDNLKPDQAGQIFRDLNKTTQVNHQEMLNSYGDIPIANAIRQTVREVSGVVNSPHPLFGYNQSSATAEKKYVHIGFNNNGLHIEEMVARMFYRYYDGGGLGTSDDADLETLYKAPIDEIVASKLTTKVWDCLDFVLSMAKIRRQRLNSPLPQKDFTLLYRLYMYLEQNIGVYSIPDRHDFFDAIYGAYSQYRLDYSLQPVELQQVSPLSAEKTIGKQFNDSLGEFRPMKSVAFPIDRLLLGVNLLSVIAPRDPQRIFPRVWRETKLIEQNYKCAVTGETLTMKDAHGAHIVSWADGGKTVYENLAMVSAYHNARMGQLSLNQYKELIAGELLALSQESSEPENNQNSLKTVDFYS